MNRQGNKQEFEISRKNRLISFKLQWWGDPSVPKFYASSADNKALVGNNPLVWIKRQVIASYMAKFVVELNKTGREPCGTSGKGRGGRDCRRCDFVHMCRSARRTRIERPPGMLLDRVTRFLLTRDAHGRFVEPVIADMRVEYCEALAAGHLWHARWIAARVYFLVIPGYVYGCVARAVKRLFSA
jgi:hypothetical protein